MAASRTKATKKSTPKAVSKKVKKGKSDSKLNHFGDEILSTIVAVQVKRNNSCLSFEAIMKARNKNSHNQRWRDQWTALIDEGYIRPASSKSSLESGKGGNGVFTSNYELTEKGKDRAGTPEQKAIKRLMETTVNTTAEEHARIRKICMNNRTVQIFDLLLKHGSLTRRELAATIGISDRGAPFSYGLRQLKQFGYVTEDKQAKPGNKLLVLSDKAFMNPKDRPEPVPIDPETMSANIEKVYGKEMRKTAAQKSSVKTEAAVKTETDVAMKTENTDGDNGHSYKQEEKEGESKKMAGAKRPKGIKKEVKTEAVIVFTTLLGMKDKLFTDISQTVKTETDVAMKTENTDGDDGHSYKKEEKEGESKKTAGAKRPKGIKKEPPTKAKD